MTAEFHILRLKGNDNVVSEIHSFFQERNIDSAMPVEARGKIKNFGVITLGKGRHLFRDDSGKGFEVNAISGKVHRDKNGFYTNISIVLVPNGVGSIHGVLKDAQVEDFLELKFRKLNLGNIIVA